MTISKIEIQWPNGTRSLTEPGIDWLQVARDAGIIIPTGCLQGSCGACEIEVNGEVGRACIAIVPRTKSCQLKVEFADDPFW